MKGQCVSYVKREDINKILEYLEKNNKIIIFGIIKFQLNTGLRISDVLNLKFEDVFTSSKIREMKTKKKKIIFFNNECLATLNKLKLFYKKHNFKNYDKNYIFKSLNDKSLESNLTYQGVNYHLKILKKELKIEYAFNTHSFRKSWAREIYYKFNDLALVMKALNHSNPSVTLRYICIEEDELKEIYSTINF